MFNEPHSRRRRGALKLAGLCLALLGLTTGCHQDMWNQPKYKPLAVSNFFPDQHASRPVVAGTVPYQGARLDDHKYKGKVDGQFASTIPYPITEEFLRRGQERFNIYCAVCHGKLGDGKSFVASRGFEAKKPANMHEQRLRDMAPGYFFDVITNGFGTMYGYASRIQNVEDRWAIVAYVNVLQLSQNATLADLPEEKRSWLDLPEHDAAGHGALEGTRLGKYLELTGQMPETHGAEHGADNEAAH